jgi:hypothetical protein
VGQEKKKKCDRKRESQTGKIKEQGEIKPKVKNKSKTGKY